MTLEPQRFKVWQATFSGNASGGVGFASGGGTVPGGGGAAASNGGGGPITGVNTANTVLGGGDDPAAQFFGGLQRLHNAAPAPAAGAKKPVSSFPFDLSAKFGDVNVSQNVSQPTTIHQAPVGGGPGAGYLQGGVQFNAQRPQGGLAHGAANAGAGVLTGSPQDMAMQLTNGDYYTQAMFLAQHSDTTARNAEARGMWHDAEFARRNAAFWREQASKVGAGQIPRFGQVPQITQTYGTWLGLLTGGAAGQVPQVSTHSYYDPNAGGDFIDHTKKTPMLHGSIFAPYGGPSGPHGTPGRYADTNPAVARFVGPPMGPQYVEHSVSGKIIDPREQTPIYDNTEYDWVEDDNIFYFDPNQVPNG